MAKIDRWQKGHRRLGYKKSFLIDMDGVINRGHALIPGADLFVRKLIESSFPFLFITNNSYHTPSDLRKRLADISIDVCLRAILKTQMRS